jgi:hypothetical protein
MATLQVSPDYELQRQRHVRARADRLPGETTKPTWPLARLYALRDERPSKPGALPNPVPAPSTCI